MLNKLTRLTVEPSRSGYGRPFTKATFIGEATGSASAFHSPPQPNRSAAPRQVAVDRAPLQMGDEADALPSTAPTRPQQTAAR